MSPTVCDCNQEGKGKNMCGDKDFLSHIHGHKQYEHSYLEKVYRHKKFHKKSWQQPF